MDPNATLIMLCRAVINQDAARFDDALEYLSVWRESGGFLPSRAALTQVCDENEEQG